MEERRHAAAYVGKFDQSVQFDKCRAKLDQPKTLDKSGRVVAATQDNRYCTQMPIPLYDKIKLHPRWPY